MEFIESEYNKMLIEKYKTVGIKEQVFSKIDENINFIRFFNNSIFIKKKYKYIAYSDFYEGIHNTNALNGIQQLKSNCLFNLVSAMPKGVIHHAHLFALTDITKNIKFVIDNYTIIPERLFICIDPFSKHFFQLFLNMPEMDKWKFKDYIINNNCILNEKYLSKLERIDHKKYISIKRHIEQTNDIDYLKNYFIEYTHFIEHIDIIKKQINLNYDKISLNNIRLVPHNLNSDNILDLFQFSFLSFKIFNKLYINLNLDVLTKWDFLEKFTICIGRIIKNKNIFPFFFSNLLYNSYTQNISVLELRTSLNSLYEWKLDATGTKYETTDFIIKNDFFNGLLARLKLSDKINNRIKQAFSMYKIMDIILEDVNEYINDPDHSPLIKIPNSFFTKYISDHEIYTPGKKMRVIENYKIDYTIICATAKGSKFQEIVCNNVYKSMDVNYNTSYLIKQMYGYTKIVGYDLYGEEDIHYNLEKFEKYIDLFKEKSIIDNLPWNYYFHAGENHNIYSRNVNLDIAIKKNAKRIGHGLQLINDNILRKKIIDIEKMEDKICIEINPISNQVLDYIPNISFHPAITFIHEKIPISISYDDLFLYGYNDVSYDWLAIIYAWNLKFDDIIKILFDSFRYSSYITNSNYKPIIIKYIENLLNWIDNFNNNCAKGELNNIIYISNYLKNSIKTKESNIGFINNPTFTEYLVDNIDENFGIGPPCHLKENMYEQKYLKYKQKYLQLKSMI